jgi:hypothetical protein
MYTGTGMAIYNAFNLTGLVTLESQTFWDQYGPFIASSGGGPNGAAQINSDGGTITFFGSSSWANGVRFNLTAGSSIQFSGSPNPSTYSIGTPYFKLQSSEMVIYGEATVTVASTGVIEATGNPTINFGGSNTVTVAGKLNFTCAGGDNGNIQITAPLTITSTGSFYSSSCSLVNIAAVRVDGILNMSSGFLNFGTILVTSGGQSLGGGQTGTFTVDVGGKATHGGYLGTLNANGEFTTSVLNVDTMNIGAQANVTGKSYTIATALTVAGKVNSTRNSNFFFQSSSTVFHVNLGVTQLTVTNFTGFVTRVDISSTTSFPTTPGYKWTFLIAEGAVLTAFDSTVITPPSGVIGTYSIVYERVSNIIKNVSVVWTAPPPALPPVAAPVAAPLAAPVAAPLAAAPLAAPVAAPLAAPAAFTPPVDGSAPSGSTGGSPVAAPVEAPVAAPVAPPVPFGGPRSSTSKRNVIQRNSDCCSV